MNKQLIKTFSEIKSSCKTRNQRLAFNELVKSFYDPGDPIPHPTLKDWGELIVDLFQEDPEFGMDPKTYKKYCDAIVKALKGKKSSDIILICGYNDEIRELSDEKVDDNWEVRDPKCKSKTILKSNEYEDILYYCEKFIPNVCWQPDQHSNGAEVYFINKKYYSDLVNFGYPDIEVF